MDWLEDQDIAYDDVADLIVHAGQIIDLPGSLGDEMQVFVHIPTGGVKPTPIIFEIDSMGLTLKGNSHRENYLKQSAPRAGY